MQRIHSSGLHYTKIAFHRNESAVRLSNATETMLNVVVYTLSVQCFQNKQNEVIKSSLVLFFARIH